MTQSESIQDELESGTSQNEIAETNEEQTNQSESAPLAEEREADAAETNLQENSDANNGQASSTAEPVQVPADAVIHTVQEGETLYGICLERYHSVNNLEQICQWNQLEDQNQLFIGQQIYLPPVQ